MLKFFLLVAVIGLASAAPSAGLSWEKAWSTFPVSSNGTQCIYSTQLSQFSCRGNGAIEFVSCDAVLHLAGVPQRVFGLGRIADSNEKHDGTTFGLYPKQFQAITNSTIYLNRTWDFAAAAEKREQVFISLYHAEVNGDFGVRVPDIKCYERLVKNINANVLERSVELDSFHHESLQKVSLIGEVLILEQIKVRRFIGGGLGGILPAFILLSLLGGPFMG
jgi:hypothetical protein